MTIEQLKKQAREALEELRKDYNKYSDELKSDLEWAMSDPAILLDYAEGLFKINEQMKDLERIIQLRSL